MKVYCSNCKYHVLDIFYNSKKNMNIIYHSCIHPNNTETSPIRIHPKNIFYNKLNSNNDCKQYKKLWWKFCIK